MHFALALSSKLELFSNKKQNINICRYKAMILISLLDKLQKDTMR